jgi:hypothetical protein
MPPNMGDQVEAPLLGAGSGSSPSQPFKPGKEPRTTRIRLWAMAWLSIVGFGLRPAGLRRGCQSRPGTAGGGAAG